AAVDRARDLGEPDEARGAVGPVVHLPVDVGVARDAARERLLHARVCDLRPVELAHGLLVPTLVLEVALDVRRHDVPPFAVIYDSVIYTGRGWDANVETLKDRAGRRRSPRTPRGRPDSPCEPPARPPARRLPRGLRRRSPSSSGR